MRVALERSVVKLEAGAYLLKALEGLLVLGVEQAGAVQRDGRRRRPRRPLLEQPRGARLLGLHHRRHAPLLDLEGVIDGGADQIGRDGIAHLQQRLQIVDGRLRVRVAELAVVGEQPIEHALERAGDGGRGLEDRRHRTLADPHDHHRRVVVQKRVGTGDELIADEADGVEVAAVIDLEAERLLRRHVRGRTDEHAGGGERVVARLLGDTEVGELHHAAPVRRPRARHEQIRRLDVAMDDAALVRIA